MRGAAVYKILRLVAGIAVLVWLIVWVDWRELMTAVQRCDPWWAAGGVTLFCTGAILATLRLKALFSRFDLPLGRALRLTLSSYFFNQLLPSGLGGDVYRTVRLRDRSGGWISAIGLLALERFIGAASLIGPAIVYAIVQHGGTRVVNEVRGHLGGSRSAVYAVLAGIAIAAVVPVLFPRVRHHLRRVTLELIATLRHLSFASVCAVIASSLGFHALRIAGMRAFLEAVGSPIAIGSLVIVLALTLLASMIPISVGALGVREGILVYTLGAYGVPHAEGLTVALLARLVVVLLGVIGAFVFNADRERAR